MKQYVTHTPECTCHFWLTDEEELKRRNEKKRIGPSLLPKNYQKKKEDGSTKIRRKKGDSSQIPTASWRHSYCAYMEYFLSDILGAVGKEDALQKLDTKREFCNWTSITSKQHRTGLGTQCLNRNVTISSDQFKNISAVTWTSDLTGKSAIWVCGKSIPGQAITTWANIWGINVYNYVPPSVPQDEYERILDNLVWELSSTAMNVVAGDFNAWAMKWGIIYTNRRGYVLAKYW